MLALWFSGYTILCSIFFLSPLAFPNVLVEVAIVTRPKMP